MSSLYLIRHGQAGLRHEYDRLSALGRTQARLLGEYLAAQKVQFGAVYSGALNRQLETAREALSAFARAGVAVPEIQVDRRWNEFDLDAVYGAVAPRLRDDDPQFRVEYEMLQRMLADDDSPVHRSWTHCDTLVVRAWVEKRYDVPGESWEAFGRRVRGSMEVLRECPVNEPVAIFSSATPIAHLIGMALGLNGQHVLRLAGVTYNTALTTMRIRGEELMLFSFNGTAHLPEAPLRTFR
ncbi:MAG TPA: histidine phosphatase family protein [Bryobacteraceae bacterium]|nr:histidine phosphatase family protein [Bryobacteraceae bacterium]